MADTDEPRFAINGKEYPIPDLTSLDVDESILLYENTGMTIDEVALNKERRDHPGLWKTLVHVAIARSDPELRQRDIAEQVGRINFLDLMTKYTLATKQADDADPPDEGSAGSESSSSSRRTSGGESETTSAGQAPDEPSASGTPESDTSTSPPIRLAG